LLFLDELKEIFRVCSIHVSSIERSYLLKQSEDFDNLEAYKPVQQLFNDPGVSFVPMSTASLGLDHHTLQVRNLLVDHFFGF